MTQVLETVPEWTNPAEIAQLVAEHGAPNYFYSEAALRDQAKEALSLGAPFGLVVRDAMKANPNDDVLSIFEDEGLHIDASSGAEAEKAMNVGFEPSRIMLTTQWFPENLEELVNKGVLINATSLRQLQTYGELFPGTEVCVRINPSVGSGMNDQTTTGGPASSFGIWHEEMPEVKRVAEEHGLTISKVHTHIGSGADPKVWQEAAEESLEIVEQFPDARAINLGGGFKVGRMQGEESADMTAIGARLEHLLKEFASRTGRELELEIEPGTFLNADAGILVGEVIDIKQTDRYKFLIVSIGMKDLLRPSLYGSQHPIVIERPDGTLPQDVEEVIVQGPNCESGDLLTPAIGKPGTLEPRLLGKAVVGDLIVVGGAGAYGRTMAPGAYNNHPLAGEVLV